MAIESVSSAEGETPTPTGGTFGLFCKTFRPHLDRFEILYRSVEAHDTSGLPFFLVVPADDLGLFRRRFGTSRLTYFTDEQILDDGAGGLEQSWVVQQLVKLCFWQASVCDAWLVLDADFHFIRDFSIRDFVDEEGRVALVASETGHRWEGYRSELAPYVRGEVTLPTHDCEAAARSVPSGHRPPKLGLFQRFRDRRLKPSTLERLPRIQRYFGRCGPDLNAMPGPIWTRESLAALVEEHLDPRRLSFQSILTYAPWEAAWVMEWELSRGAPNRFVTHPFFLHFATDAGIEQARSEGWTAADFARRFLGLALAVGHQEIRRY